MLLWNTSSDFFLCNAFYFRRWDGPTDDIGNNKNEKKWKKTHSLFNFCYIKQPHFLPFFSSEKEKFAHSNYILMMNSRREKIPKVKLCYSYFKVIQFNRQNTRHPQIKSTKFQITIHCIHRMCFSDQCRSCKFNKHWPLEFPVEIYILTTF